MHKQPGRTARARRQEVARARITAEKPKPSDGRNIRMIETVAGVMAGRQQRAQSKHFSACDGNCGRLPAICQIAAGLFYETVGQA